MISQTSRHRCFGCNHQATRQVVVDNRAAWFCDMCLTPEEILAACADLGVSWPGWRRRAAAADERRGSMRFDLHIYSPSAVVDG